MRVHLVDSHPPTQHVHINIHWKYSTHPGPGSTEYLERIRTETGLDRSILAYT